MTRFSEFGQVRRGGQYSEIMHNTRVFLSRLCLQGLHVRVIVVTSSSVVTPFHFVAVGLFLSMVPVVFCFIASQHTRCWFVCVHFFTAHAYSA